ncbi:MAG TPA: phosphatidate cytidylyltransferase [Rhizomicrobium sp.]|nr:phosphatidate cytidylyltransferase [Rhizomicrobium sp.]
MPDSLRSTPRQDAASANSFRKRFRFSWNWITRPFFGLLLAAVAIGATWKGDVWFGLFLAIVGAAGAREWHRMFAPDDFVIPTCITAFALAAAVTVRVFPTGAPITPFLILLAGSAVNFMIGYLRHQAPLAHAGGVVYIGLPAVSLLMLRLFPLHPLWLVVIFFLAVWATDTGALVSGNLMGGPKLAPKLSPNKTWAGFVGGIACASIACAILASALGARVAAALVFGIAMAVAGHIGDLFESMMKRRSGRKNSGGLIPGHGGVLDRIDSALFAAPFAAVLVVVLRFDPLAGLQP